MSKQKDSEKEERHARARAEAAAYRKRQEAGSAESVNVFLRRNDELADILEPMLDETMTASFRKLDKGSAGQPEWIGPYRILGPLGQGGMGVVYLAEQKEPVEREVALKLIRPGMGSSEVLARFEIERQALAVMNHPTIAKVFDAGVTDEGQPYFVMEVVEGVPITDFCDLYRLPLKARIQIFQQVCSGVHHAHQKSVLHRDLKPANIQAALIGGQTVIKIIDFGLARATNPASLGESVYGQEGRIVGTPSYMSPEQVKGRPEDIDTRTDIYSLGVVLYQLLTGELPFQRQDPRDGDLLDVYRSIEEEVPERPSSRILSRGEAAAEQAIRRSTTPANLRKSLQGELDWIVMRAIAKEPDRRYESAMALALDLRNYLRGDAVDAGPDSAWYRASRLVRKYRIQTIAGVMVAAIAIACVLLVWSYALDSYNESRRADIETTNARTLKNELTSLEAVANRERKRARDARKDSAAMSAELRRQTELNAARAGSDAARADRLAGQAKADREKLDRLSTQFAKLEKKNSVLSNRFDHYSVALRLEELRERASTVLDRWPPDAIRLQRWTTDGAAIAKTLPRVREGLAVQRASKTDPKDVFLLETLTRLAADLDSFGKRQGLLARMHRRLSFARSIEDLTKRHPNARHTWEEALKAIARADGAVASRLYARSRIRLTPQLGLLPIGMNPETRLWEFYHLRSAWDPWSETDPAELPIPTHRGGTSKGRGSIEVEAGTGIVLVLLPGGTFSLGKSRPTELDPFFVARHELTHGQWSRMAENYEEASAPRSGVDPRSPVTRVTWHMCRTLLRRHGLTLPTEAQWEYGCRAGTNTQWSSGDRPSSLSGYANILEAPHRSRGRPVLVGSFRSNPFGLFDVHGNVSEWCRDRFGSYNMPPNPGDGERRVQGDFDALRVLRGGSYSDSPDDARSFHRSSWIPTNRAGTVGVRAARSLSEGD